MLDDIERKFKKAFDGLSSSQKKMFEEEFDGDRYSTLDKIIGRAWRSGQPDDVIEELD